jgi:ATP-binding cassette subfamily F protein uup
LIRGLLGDIPLSSGSVKLGTQLTIAYFDQLRQQLDPEKSVMENVVQGSDFIEINGARKHALAYLQDFLFSPQRSRTPVKALSGGERNRLLLAKLLSRPANLLVMDEPTNDLDIESLELLEECLTNFNGTLLLISHDREFLDNVVTSTWAFEGDGVVNEYVGGYEDWLRQRSVTAATPEKSPSEKIEKNDKKTSTPPPPNTTTQRKKLSYKEQRELEQLPQQIAQLESEQKTLSKKLENPNYFVKHPQEAAQSAERLAAIDDELLALLERWEALE